jgi:ABC-type uncharacterized transport system ATPase subunit
MTSAATASVHATGERVGAQARPLPIEVQGLTKRCGWRTVVRDLSFVARPGRVTGFGPNGSGNSTTMKIILDLASAATRTRSAEPEESGAGR